MSDHVISEIDDGIQTIRIERMDAENRLTAEICERLADSLSFGESSSRVRAVLLAGTPGDAPAALRALGRNAVAECVLGFGIVAIVAELGITMPGSPMG